jgi:hypothetical protein
MESTDAVLRPAAPVVLGDYRYYAKSGPLPFQADFRTEFTVTVHAAGALLRVVQDGFPTDAVADELYAGCEKGWYATFAGLRRYLEQDGA